MTHTISAHDLASLATCDRKVFMDHHGDRSLAVGKSAFELWIARQGQEFERQIVEQAAGQADLQKPAHQVGDLETGFQQTLSLMRSGTKLIYQGVLIDRDLVGIPDLLVRTDGQSQLGPFHYRPIDIKSSTEARSEHGLQVMFYCLLLEALQGVRPTGSLYLRMKPDAPEDAPLFNEVEVVVDEDTIRESIDYARQLAGGYEPQPFIYSACSACPWREVCTPIAEQMQDISLIPGMRRTVGTALRQQGFSTLDSLAQAPIDTLMNIRGIGEKTAHKIKNQARAMAEDRAILLRLPVLPDPAPQELFFDIESVPGEGIIYLMGVLIRRGDEAHFTYDLARHPDEQPAMWESFLARISGLIGPVFHYGQYERSTIDAMMARYGEDARALALLDRMIDLDKALKASLVLPLRSYSLKTVAQWLGYTWTGATTKGDSSMVDYMTWLETGNLEHLDNILHYNQDDVQATQVIRNWLNGIRQSGST